MAASTEFDPILILYAFLAIVQTVATMLPGFWYARKGTVSVDVRRTLSLISFNLLLPAMNFYNILSQISASTVVHYVPFAISTVLSNCTGMLLGWGAADVTNTPRHLRYHVVAAAGFGNMNSLPLMIVAAICGQQKLPFYQDLGASCSSVGWGYVALGSAATQILTYPIAIWLLKKRPQPPRSFMETVQQLSKSLSRALLGRPAHSVQPALELGSGVPAPAKHASAPPTAPAWHRASDLTQGQEAEAAAAVSAARLESAESGLGVSAGLGGSAEGSGRCSGSEKLGGSSVKEGAGSSPPGLLSSSSARRSSADEAAGDVAAGPGSSAHEAAAAVGAADEGPPAARWRRWGVATWGFTRDNVLKPPCLGAGVGVVFGVITPVKDLFVPEESAPLGFIMGTVGSIQDALIFVTSFVLGAVLSKGPGPGGRPLGWKPLLLVTVIRMGLLPLIGCVVVIGSWKLGWYHVLNPVYSFVLLMQWAVPTANQMQNIASMSSNHEKEMGALVFWQYVAALIAIPGWMVLFLYLMAKFNMYD